MQPTIHLIRAIGTEFVRRSVRPFIVVGGIAALLLLVLGIYLMTVNIWWAIVGAVVVLWVFVFAVLMTLVLVFMRTIDPPQSSSQRKSVRRYVDKLQRVAEHAQTPQLVILFRVVRDTVRPREGRENFIVAVSRDTRSLTPDFIALQEEFRTVRNTRR